MVLSVCKQHRTKVEKLFSTSLVLINTENFFSNYFMLFADDCFGRGASSHPERRVR